MRLYLHLALTAASALLPSPPHLSRRPVVRAAPRAAAPSDDIVTTSGANKVLDDTAPSVAGAACLIAGNMVGGGILAIPTVAAEPGFWHAPVSNTL